MSNNSNLYNNSHNIEIENKYSIKLQIWDTAGQ
jgi:GTPase SAR1 family protein